MKQALVVDHDRDSALRTAAAVKGDALRASPIEEGRDALDQIRSDRPELVLARASGGSGESGFALCHRIKKSKRLGRTVVVIYDDADHKAALDAHAAQEHAADAYVTIEEGDLTRLGEVAREQAETMEDAPPPLPELEPAEAPAQADDAFIEKVADSLSHVDPSADIPSAPPVRRAAGRTTADAKLDMLRQKLRQREAELAKLMGMYRAKEREYHEWNERLVDKDVEAQSLRMSLEELSQQAEQAQSELDRRTDEFNQSFEQLLEEKVGRENELIQIVAEKERDLSELEAIKAKEEGEASSTREALEGELAASEQAVADLQDEIERHNAELEARGNKLASTAESLAEAEARIEALETLRDELTQEVSDTKSASWMLEEKTLELRGSLAALRDEVEEAQRTHAEDAAAREAFARSVREDLASALEECARLQEAKTQLESTLEARAEEIARLETELEARAQRIAELEAAGDEAARAHAELDETRKGLETELENRAQQLLEAQAQGDVYGVELERVQGELEALGVARDALAQDFENARAVHAQTDAEARETQMRLEGQLAEVEQVLAEEKAAAEKEAEALREQLVALGADLAEKGDRVDALERSLENEQLERAAADRMIQSLERGATQTQEELQVERAEVRTQAGLVAELRAELAQRSGKLESVEGALSDALRGRDQVSTLFESLRGEHDERGSEIGRLETKVHALESRLSTAEGELSEARVALENARADIGARDALLDNARQDLGEKLEQARAQAAARAEELARKEEGLRRVQEELERLRATGSEERHEAMEERTRLLERTETLTAELERARASTEAAQAEVSRLTEALEAARRRAADREKELVEAVDERDMHNATLVEERHELETGRSQDAQRIEGLERELEAARTRAAELSAQLQSAQSSAQEESEKATVAHAELQDRIVSERASAEEALAKLRAEHQYALEAQTARGREAVEAAQASAAELDEKLRSTESTGARARAELERALAESKRENEHLNETLGSERSARIDEQDRLRRAVSERDERLEEATSKVATLTAEKRALEDRMASDVGVRQSRVVELEGRLEERRVELERVQAQVETLESRLRDAEQNREEVETRYVRELEDVHESYMRRAQEADETHSREIESLRTQLLEAKRSLRTSQLAAQRLTERVQKLETGRPTRTTARAEFESFIAKVSSDPKAPVPRSDGPSSGRRPVAAPSPATMGTGNRALSGRAGLPESKPEEATTAVEEAPEGVGSEIDDFLRSQFEGYDS